MSVPSMADQVNIVGDNLTILLIVVSSAAFLVTMYNLIALLLCGRHASNQDLEQTSPRLVTGTMLSTPSTAESSVAHLIPAYKYKKKMDVADEDGVCAVCLGNFEDGEDLKILPECLHSFHVPCIDMWLYSHSNCPICRTDATPSLEIPSHVPDFNSNESNRSQSLELQNVVLQSSIV